jgi:Family of unknown function (DUF5681)
VPFAPGQSGNPRGRRPGVRLRITVLAEKLMQNDVPDVVRSVVAAARGGDMVAARLILERIVPVRRGSPVALKLPLVDRPADLVAALAAVTEAVSTGELTPDEGQAVAAILEGQRRAIETAELEERIARLEAKNET